MGGYAMRVIALVGAVVLCIGLVIEMRNWRAGRRIISRKQQALRLSAGVLLVFLFVLIFLGSLVTREINPLLFLSYWMGCFIIGCAIVVLMMLDLREVGFRYREQHREMMRRMVEEAKRKE